MKAYDVKSAFLQSDSLQREVYVEPPPEKYKKDIIWKLKKPVYGLPDASRLWYMTIKSFLSGLGMSQSRGDSCLFMYRKGAVLEGMILVHIDDFLAAGSKHYEKEVVQKMLEKFKFGTISSEKFMYTGIEINQDEKKRISMNQDQFIKDLSEYQFLKQDSHKILNKTENSQISGYIDMLG